MWGLFPLYWRLLDSLTPATITAHRVVWSFVLLVLLSLGMPRLRTSLGYLRNRRNLVICSGAAAMIALNWGGFMYAVGTDQVLQASLGYYINPLLNVVLGVVVLGEQLKRFQWIAVGSAVIGVAVMTLGGTGVPWIALTVAGAFATYGLLKKKTQLPALEGMMVEMGLLFPIAVAFLMMQWPASSDAAYGSTIWTLLVLGGLISVTPLALFAVAAKRVTLSTIGILQYVGPTLQWFVGAILFDEPFAGSKLVGFLFVWAGVIVFVVGGVMTQPRSRASSAA